MKILRDYLESELDLFRKECNFTESELEYFNLKASRFGLESSHSDFDRNITVTLNI